MANDTAPAAPAGGKPTGGNLHAFQQQLGEPYASPAPQQARQQPAQQPQAGWPGDMPPASDQPALPDDSTGMLPIDDDQAGMEDALSQQEPPPGTETDEDGNALADPMDEDVHGVKARELLEAIKAGKVPGTLDDKLMVEVSPNGEQRVVSLGEVKKGYMRQVDYTRSQQKTAEERRSYEQFQRGWEATLEEWQGDTSKMRKGMRRFGLGGALYKVAEEIAKEEYALSQLPPELAAERRRVRALEIEAEDRAEQLQELERTKTDQKRRQSQERFNRQMGEFTPLALSRAGLKDTPGIRQRYIAMLEPLWKANDRRLSMEICEQAAVSAKEAMIDEAKMLQLEQQGGSQMPSAAQAMGLAPQQRQAAPQPLPVRRAAPAPASNAARGPQTGGTLSDFRAHLRRVGSRV